jgi:hypothetical protein
MSYQYPPSPTLEQEWKDVLDFGKRVCSKCVRTYLLVFMLIYCKYKSTVTKLHNRYLWGLTLFSFTFHYMFTIL